MGSTPTSSPLGATTFGLEVEIHVAALPKGKEDPDHGDGRKPTEASADVPTNTDEHMNQAEKIISGIVEHVRNETGIEIKASRHEHPVEGEITPDCSATERKFVGRLKDKGYYEVYENWTLCFDASRAWYAGGEKRKPPVAPGNYVWFPLELKTRADGNIEDIYDELSRIIRAVRAKYRVSVKCGQGESRTNVHVHVGSGSKNGFDLKILKRLLTLSWLYEPAIVSLHAEWKQKDVRYASLLHRHSHLASLLDRNRKLDTTFYKPSDRRKPGLEEFSSKFDLEGFYQMYIQSGGDPKEWLRIIWGAQDIEYLAWLAASQFGERRPALSLHALAPVDSTLIHQTRTVTLGTVEFRHMQGSFDVDDIMNWAKVAVRMVKTYEDLDDGRFVKLIHVANNTGDTSNPQGFFRAIGFGVAEGWPQPRFKEQSRLNDETTPPGKNGPFYDIFLPPVN